MLIAPRQASGWRVSADALDAWLVGRWPEIKRGRGTSRQRANVWEWPDRYEVWVPGDENCVWIAADWARVSAVAAWLGTGSDDLILCDEGYSFVVELRSTSEEQLQALEP